MPENIYALLFLITLVLLVVSIIALIFMVYLYFSSKSEIPDLARKEFEKWRSHEIQSIKEESLSLARREMQIELEHWKRAIEQQVRLDAIQKSQAVTLGKITEHFIPYLPDFTYNPKDARFIGSPIDFIVFDGLTDGEVRKVVFMEIKTGSASLSSRERRIRDAIMRGNVSWEELRSNFNLEELS